MSNEQGGLQHFRPWMIHHSKKYPGKDKLIKFLDEALTEYEDHNEIIVQQ